MTWWKDTLCNLLSDTEDLSITLAARWYSSLLCLSFLLSHLRMYAQCNKTSAHCQQMQLLCTVDSSTIKKTFLESSFYLYKQSGNQSIIRLFNCKRSFRCLQTPKWVFFNYNKEYRIVQEIVDPAPSLSWLESGRCPITWMKGLGITLLLSSRPTEDLIDSLMV